jgi:hypothetical protein
VGAPTLRMALCVAFVFVSVAVSTGGLVVVKEQRSKFGGSCVSGDGACDVFQTFPVI